MPVEDFKQAVLCIHGADGHILVHMLDFVEAGVRVPVGVHQAVAAEIGVGGGVLPVVSAVRPATLLVVEALVHPVPDKAALQVLVGIELLPHPVNGAIGIAHGMGVLAEGDGLGRIAFSHPAEPFGSGIHGVQEVRIPFGLRPFVHDGAVLAIGLQGLEDLVGLVEVHTVAGLVAQGQDGHARVAGRPVIHVEGAVQMLFIPLRLVAQGFLEVIAHAVGFDIGLVVHIEAQGVAELVELPLLGIVAGADGVDIAKLHELEVFQDVLPGGVVAGIGIVLMQVHALEFHRLSIHQEGLYVPFPVLDGNNLQAAETHMEAGVFPVYAQHQGVELGGFGAPAADFGNTFRDGFHRAGELEGGVGHGLPVLVQQLIEYFRGLCGRHLELEQAGGKIGVQSGDHPEVETAVFALAGKVNIPLQAGDAPEILVFQPGGLGVAVNLE